MWRSGAGNNVDVSDESDDDWETDANFENDVSEKEQRWGSKSIEGSGRVENVSMDAVRQGVVADNNKDNETRKPNFAHGYGGKFGVQADRQDKSAMGNDYQAEKAVHSSQKDQKKGFGGEFGLQGTQDKSALGYDADTSTTAHPSTAKKQAEAPPARAPPVKQQQQQEEEEQEEEEEQQEEEQQEEEQQEEEEEQQEEEQQEQEEEQQEEEQQEEEQAAEDEWADDGADEEEYAAEEVIQAEDDAAPAGDAPSATALFDYQAAGEDEITFDPEEIIEDVEQVDEGWWMGTCRGKRGLFPANYVEMNQ